MANGHIGQLLEFANMQMAAEAFLSQSVDSIPNRPPADQIQRRLENGNFHASRFMPVQADKFVADYEVLAQYRNDPLLAGGTGFSGTLFRNRATGELTLSFRSTEFIDDAVRDSKSTSELEIKDLGWAFGQIAEMEAWYTQLRQDPALLGGQNFNVTGYSLGGHLATAFNILRREEAMATGAPNPVIATYTFNGAGTGAILDGRRLTDIIADFNRIRADYTASPEWTSLSVGDQNTVSALAQSRVDAINAERFRVASLSGVTRAFAASAPTGSQTLLGYQIAAQLVGQNTVGASNFPLPGGTNYIPSSPVFAPDALRFANMTEVVGMETGGLATSFVSNSGVHYGYRQEIAIEAQPAVRGLFLIDYLLGFNLLVDNPDKNNFADTHSLVLVVDALSLMAAMEKLAPNLTIETAGQVFAAMSNAAASDFIGTQGAAEGDTLERALDAMRKLVLGPGQDPTLDRDQMLKVLEGNTWHENANRAPFQDRLKDLRDRVTALTALNETFVLDSLVSIGAAQLAAIAGSSEAMAYRYALKELNPFAVVGDTANAVIYSWHNLAGELDLYSAANRIGTLTSEWITDRVAFVSWKNRANTTNVTLLQSDQTTEPWRFVDLPQNYTVTILQPGGTAIDALTHRAVFGGDGADLVEGGAKADRLYGGGSTDYLIGKGDADYLEGGPALDIYQYSGYAGLIGSNDGSDTIRDVDGRGVLRYVWNDNPAPMSTIIADASVKVTDTQWQSADGRFTYTKTTNDQGRTDLVVTIIGDAGGSLTLKDFRDGDFGIRLWQPRTVPQYTATTNTVIGNDNPNTLPGTAAADLIQAFAGADTVNAGVGDDIVEGGDGGDVLHGEADRDRLYGEAGRDQIDGGSENDELYGGLDPDILEGRDGADLLAGQQGADVAAGDAGDDEVYAGEPVALATALGLAETQTASGLKGDWADGGEGNDIVIAEADNDQVMGGGGADVMVGGAGDDNLVGDLERTLVNIDNWAVTREIIPSGNTVAYQLTYNADAQVAASANGAGDTIYGGAGADWVFSGAGGDFIDGGSGNDVAFGEAGGDVLIGGTGNDVLVGDNPGVVAATDEGGDYLDGGADDDNLQGNGGDDILIGGVGNDTLSGGAGKDIYVFNRGNGTDTIFDTDANSSSPDASVLVLDGVDRSAIKFFRGSLGIDLGPTDPADPNSPHDIIHVEGFDYLNPTATTPLGEIHFADGTSMSYVDILAQGFDIDGTAGNDNGQAGEPPMLVGTGVTDRIRGFGGDDILFGLTGNDVLDGGAGFDQIVGGAGSDAIDAADGDDQLWGDADGLAAAEQGADVMSGGFGNDYLQGYGGDDQMFGDEDNDALYGEAGADYVEGGRGNDYLYGDGPATPLAEQGNDTLAGGPGIDQLVGYAGNDTYLFGRGDGQDLIYDVDATVGNVDMVEFAADITPDDVTATRGPVFANDLVLTITGTTDELTVANQFSVNTANRVEEIRFTDGTVWTPTATPMLIQGTAANNVINGTSSADLIEGLAGNDTLQGGTGGDRYRFYRGDGADLITDSDATVGNVDKVLYAANILPSEIQASRSGDNLVLRLTGTADQVTISNYFQNDGATSYSMEEIKFFADGTVWDVNTVKQMVLTGTSGAEAITGYTTDDTLTGLGGNDTLTGGAGNDTLNAGTENDVLQGGTGNDIYLIARGDGQDTITDIDETVGNVDKIIYANDILPSEIKATRSGNNLVLSLTGAADQVTVTNYFENDGATSSLVEEIEFLADGTIWDLNTVKTLVLTGTSSNDTLTGYATDDLLAGLGGGDMLIGNAGNDTLDGGTGNDIIEGGTGNDTYRIFRGDGQDKITDSDSIVGNIDNVVYAADILPSQVKAVRSLSNLVLQLMGTTDQVTINSYFLNDGASTYTIEEIQFPTDGTVWDVNTVRNMVIVPTSGADTIIGYATDDVLNGLGGSDLLLGYGGNDTLDGGPGIDNLVGHSGSDTYLFARGSEGDIIFNSDLDTAGTTDVLSFAADILPSHITATRSYNDLWLTVSGTTDEVEIISYFLGGYAIVEEIRFADGTVWTESTIANMFPINGTSGNDSLQGSALSEVINGLAGNDTLRGGGGNDTMDGGLGSDQLYGEDGNDTLFAGTGESKNASVSNYLAGGNGNDVLIASGKPDSLHGDAGNDILVGAAGVDTMDDTGGNNLFSGGASADAIGLGDQNDLVIGGTGNDSIDGDSVNSNGVRGHDVLLFNKSDGQDSVNRLGTGSTISIGGGTLYSNLSLEIQGTTLRLKTASSHYISLTDWYGSPANKAVSTLQIVIEGTRDYKATSINPMNNKKIQAFDFLELVAAFDAARAAGQTFNVANNLVNYRISGSDTHAIGGVLAYQYARTGSISTLSYDQMRAVISDPAFAVGAQSITVSAAAASASASTVAPIMTDESAAAFSVTTDARLVIGAGTAASGSADAIATAEVETVSGVGTAPAPGGVDRAEARVMPELLTHGQAASVAVDSSIPPVGAVASGDGFATTPDVTTPRAPRAAAPAGALDQSAGFVPNEANAAGSDTGAGVNAQTHSRHSGAAPDDSMEKLAAEWFNRRSPQEDLSLLDDIARGEGSVNAPSHGSVVAAWEASHRWLSQYANARKDNGEASADGADLSGLSLLGTGSASYDMPQPVVGLRNVSGHQLASFRGLREGVSVLQL